MTLEIAVTTDKKKLNLHLKQKIFCDIGKGDFAIERGEFEVMICSCREI